MTVELRYYQKDAIEGVRYQISIGNRRVLIVIPTGGGKTVTAASIIRSAVAKGKRVIFLAHRIELIEQSSSTLSFLGVDHGVMKSGHPKLDLNKQVQVASVQTLIKRDHWPADLVVIDEAHRSMAATYVELVNRYETHDNATLLGLTATPYRLDGKPLGDIYNAMVETVSAQELIEFGHLVNPIVYGAESVDLSNVGVGARGDYNKKQSAAAMAKTILHGELLSQWARICGESLGAQTTWYTDDEGRRRVSETTCDACTVAFLPTIKKSMEVAEQFRAAGVKVEHIDGKTDKRKRKNILKALEMGDIHMVTNVDILCEGWDLPRLECVIGARPTRSLNIYKQMGGRLMRPDDNKRFAYLLDHANWTRTHGFLYEYTEHSLEKAEVRKRKGSAEAPLKKCPECGAVSYASTRVCMDCKYEWPIGEIEFEETELVELDSEMVARADVVPLEERQRAFEAFATQCVSRERKPHWARIMYQKAYGVWPSAKTGIKEPYYFKQYEKRLNKMLNQQMVAQAASDAFSS